VQRHRNPTTLHRKNEYESLSRYSVGLIERQPLAPQQQDYRGYRIVIRRYGGGWRAKIYAPNSEQPILGPQSDDPTSYDDGPENAKRLIDALMIS
jgi:hypothetical protein